MCGITGIFNLDSKAINQDILNKMTSSLSHRGPDDEGLYISGKIGLGHRRLSIIDLSSRGHQPMSNEDGSIWITYNGEIYNHLVLRKQLEKKGHRYKSQTDTETIIHLYEEKGFRCLEDLDGEFAFCIWDSKKKTIFSSRDRLGIKPFYYYISNKIFVFASEIKAILLHPEVKKEADLQAISDYLSFSVSPAPLTCFKNIFKLEAGHYLLVKEDTGLTKERYWDAIPKKKINCSEEEAVELLRQKLKTSIRERLMSDVPLGVFLSGGVDSSANVALMSEMINGPVNTFNVAIDGLDTYDESRSAQLISEYFNTKHRDIRIKFDDFYRIFDGLAYYSDEPLCDYACIPNFYLANLSRQEGVSVIQVGEGNDELFCGYRSYATMLNIIKFYYPLPALIKKPLFYLLKFIQGRRLHYSIEQALKDEEVFLGGSYLFTEKEKRFLFNKSVKFSDFNSPCTYVSKIYNNLLSKFPQAGPLDKMLYLDLKVRLPELLLMRQDKMSMANSVEARLPYLDYQFVEYAFSLPSKFKYRHNQTKYIFKKSLKGILPEGIILQSKRGFAGTPLNLFNRDFQNYALTLFQDTKPLLAEWFNADSIKDVFSSNSNSMTFREGMKAWSIFMLMLWLKKFFIEK